VASRQVEQRAASLALGGRGSVVFLGWRDGELESGLRQRADVCYWIRRLRPDVVLGHDPWKRYRLHPDHRHAGLLVTDGIVAARETEPGQIASPGTPLVRIVNVKTVYYEPTISETDFAQTAVGNPVAVRADALPGKTFMGRIVRVFPAAGAGSRVFSLRVSVYNPQNTLRPGMFARGAIVTREARNVPLVPTTALVPIVAAQGFTPNTSSDAQISPGVQSGPQQVFLVGPDNTAQPRTVQVGVTTMDKTQITSGLEGGERIVVVGQQTLKKGDKLAIPNGPDGARRGPQTAQAS